MVGSGLILAFVTGLISSFGHCLGMCGGLVAIYAAHGPVLATVGETHPSLLARVGRLIPLHAGRILTYSVLGAVIGLAGSLLQQVGGWVGWQGIFSMVIGAAMIAIALSLMRVLPPIEVALNSLISGASPIRRMHGLLTKGGPAATLGLGVLWGFLPCGLVFAMLVVAAGTQTPWGGALTMVAFGLGTMPTLLGFGLAANLLSPRFRGRLQFLAGIVILVFALQTILRGLAAANLIHSLVIGPVMLW